jgi:hypothetical protein
VRQLWIFKETFNSAELGIIHRDASQLEKNFTAINQKTNLGGKTGSGAMVGYEPNIRLKRKRKNPTLFTLLIYDLRALILAWRYSSRDVYTFVTKAVQNRLVIKFIRLGDGDKIVETQLTHCNLPLC